MSRRLYTRVNLLLLLFYLAIGILRGVFIPIFRASYLASPPLVVAYALAGTMAKDLINEPLALNDQGRPIYLKDIWPSNEGDSTSRIDGIVLVTSLKKNIVMYTQVINVGLKSKF